MINQGHLLFTILSFFGTGILLAFTPCIFPMIPILSSILAGEEKLGAKRSFLLSLTFVLSMALTYAGAGLLAGYFGGTVQTALQKPGIILSFSLIFVLMALSMFGVFTLSLPRFLQNYLHHSSNQQKRGNYFGVAVMGFLSTLIASPCVTPPLVAALTYISQTGDAFLGAVILFSLALGMGLPLLIFGMGQGALLPRAGQWMNQVKQLFGMMLLGLAIWTSSRILPGTVSLFLWSALLIISAVTLGCLEFQGGRKLPPLFQGVLVLVLLYGCLLLVGAASGHDKLWSPLSVEQTVATVAPADLFIKVNTLAEVEQKLAEAKKIQKPVLLEFYASWCETCRDVDAEAFSDFSVQQHLKNFMVLRVDITNKNAALTQLISHFHVFGTPTIIFYDHHGQRVETQPFNKGVSKPVFDKILTEIS